MPDSHRRREEPDPAPGPADELFGGSRDPAETGPIRVRPDDTLRSPVVSAPGPELSAVPRRWPGLGVLTVLAIVLLVVFGTGLWAAARSTVVAGTAIPADPGMTMRSVAGVGLVERATRTDTDCAAHSYGRVQGFLAAHPCHSLRRALYTGIGSVGPVVVAVATVELASDQVAADLQKLADTDGTGNVSDLLREGVRVEGAPPRLSAASYASRRHGSVLIIVEADSASGANRSLQPLAEAALVLGG